MNRKSKIRTRPVDTSPEVRRAASGRGDEVADAAKSHQVFRGPQRRADYNEAPRRCQPDALPRPARHCFAVVAALLCASALSWPAEARADGQLYLGPVAANLNTLGDGGLWGLGGRFGGQLSMGDFWGVFADVAGSYHFENTDEELPADVVSVLSAGLRYNLDIFAYVPYIGLGATAYLDAPLVDGESAQANAGAKFLLGVDWRYDRFWSLGFAAEIHALLTDLDRYPVYSQVGAYLGYHFRL